MQLFTVALTLGLAIGCAAKKVPSWACPLENCALKSPLASAGPGFQDGVRFFTVGTDGKDVRRGCPFGGGDDEPEPSKKEYMKYMKAMNKVAEMSPEDRRAYAKANQQKWLEESEEPASKKPSIDVTKPGVEAVDYKEWSRLRNANKFDFLITFYAPWCPHCKAFVTSENAPIKALSESLEKVGGPKVVTFDMVADTPPITIDAVPAIFLFKKTGEAIEFKGNPHDLESLMTFALDKKTQSLLALKEVPHAPARTVRSWACPLKNCVLRSPLASAGPGFPDGVRFSLAASGKTDTRETCPFGGGPDEKEPSKKEYMKYMKGLDKVGDMNADQRRAYAMQMEQKWLDEADEPEKKIKDPTVDVTKAGVHAVTYKTWNELRNANKYDLLITFYAPWCPHCKKFVKSANAPINALSESLEAVNGPKVVSFDIEESSPPLTIDAVPTIFLFKTTGEAITFEGNPTDVEGLMAFALDNATPKKEAKQALVTKHLRTTPA